MKLSNFLSSFLTAAIVNQNDKPAVCWGTCPAGFERKQVGEYNLCTNCDSFESDGNGRFVCAKQGESITVALEATGSCQFPLTGHLDRGVPAACTSRCPITASSIVLKDRTRMCYDCDQFQAVDGVLTCGKNGLTRQFLVNALNMCGVSHTWVPKEPSPRDEPTLYLGSRCDTGYQSVLPVQDLGFYKICHNCDAFTSNEGQISCLFKGQTFPYAEKLLPILNKPKFSPKLEAEFPACRTKRECPVDTFSMEVGDTSVCFNCTNADLDSTTFSCTVNDGKRFTSAVDDIAACYKPEALPPAGEKEALVCIGNYICPEGTQPATNTREPICHNCDSFVQDGELGSSSGWFNCTRAGRESSFQQVPDCGFAIEPFEMLRESSPGAVCGIDIFYDRCPLLASSLYHDAWPDMIACHNCDSVIRTQSGVECVKDGKREAVDTLLRCSKS